jgi:homocysteine S-methyltransferase
MSKVKLVDGGFSTQLVKHVGPIVDGDPLWTARFLCTDKEKCILVHRDFIKGKFI